MAGPSAAPELPCDAGLPPGPTRVSRAVPIVAPGAPSLAAPAGWGSVASASAGPAPCVAGGDTPAAGAHAWQVSRGSTPPRAAVSFANAARRGSAQAFATRPPAAPESGAPPAARFSAPPPPHAPGADPDDPAAGEDMMKELDYLCDLAAQHPPPAPAKNPYLVKTQLCRHFANGLCLHGSRCNFAHGEHELKIKKSEPAELAAGAAVRLALPATTSASKRRLPLRPLQVDGAEIGARAIYGHGGAYQPPLPPNPPPHNQPRAQDVPVSNAAAFQQQQPGRIAPCSATRFASSPLSDCPSLDNGKSTAGSGSYGAAAATMRAAPWEGPAWQASSVPATRENSVLSASGTDADDNERRQQQFAEQYVANLVSTSAGPGLAAARGGLFQAPPDAGHAGETPVGSTMASVAGLCKSASAKVASASPYLSDLRTAAAALTRLGTALEGNAPPAGGRTHASGSRTPPADLPGAPARELAAPSSALRRLHSDSTVTMGTQSDLASLVGGGGGGCLRRQRSSGLMAPPGFEAFGASAVEARSPFFAPPATIGGKGTCALLTPWGMHSPTTQQAPAQPQHAAAAFYSAASTARPPKQQSPPSTLCGPLGLGDDTMPRPAPVSGTRAGTVLLGSVAPTGESQKWAAQPSRCGPAAASLHLRECATPKHRCEICFANSGPQLTAAEIAQHLQGRRHREKVQTVLAEAALFVRRNGGSVSASQLQAWLIDRAHGTPTVPRLLTLLSAAMESPFGSMDDVLVHVLAMPLSRGSAAGGSGLRQAPPTTTSAASGSRMPAFSAARQLSPAPAESPIRSMCAPNSGSGDSVAMLPNEDLRAHLQRLRRAIEGASTSATRKQLQ